MSTKFELQLQLNQDNNKHQSISLIQSSAVARVPVPQFQLTAALIESKFDKMQPKMLPSANRRGMC